jgi:hypothetical protein
VDVDLMVRFRSDFNEELTYFPIVLHGTLCRLKYLHMYGALCNLLKISRQKFQEGKAWEYEKRNENFFLNGDKISLILSCFDFDERKLFHVRHVSVGL